MAGLFFLFLGFFAWTQSPSVSRIERESDNRFFLPADNSWRPGQHIVIVRPSPHDPDEKEVIASGQVRKDRSGGNYLDLDADLLKKRPLRGDRVLTLGAPKIFEAPPEAPSQPRPFPQVSKPEPTEPGYIALGFTRLQQDLTTRTDSQVDSLKNLKSYSPQGLSLEWYFDFLSSYGFSFQNVGANVPIETYYRDSIAGEAGSLDLRLLYRRQLLNPDERWRWTLAIGTHFGSFHHDNPDEYVISSKANGAGAGFGLAWEPGRPLLTDQRFRFQWTSVSGSVFYVPSLTVTDELSTRGTSSSGSTWTEIKVGSSWTLFWPWIPWVKRYFLSVDYVQQTASLRFQGPTREAPNCFCTIPEGGAYTEQNSGVKLTLGVRFSDFIGNVFRPRE